MVMQKGAIQRDDLIEFVRSWNRKRWTQSWKKGDDLIEFVRSWNPAWKSYTIRKVMI